MSKFTIVQQGGDAGVLTVSKSAAVIRRYPTTNWVCLAVETCRKQEMTARCIFHCQWIVPSVLGPAGLGVKQLMVKKIEKDKLCISLKTKELSVTT